jgi:hypothetical protein
MLVQWPNYTHCLNSMSQSSCTNVQPCFCTMLNMVKSHMWHILRGIIGLCYLTLGVTSNTYCSRKYYTFTVVSSLTYILLPTGARGCFSHPMPPYTVWVFFKEWQSLLGSALTVEMDVVAGLSFLIELPNLSRRVQMLVASSPGRSNFFKMASNIYGSSTMNLLRVSFLEPIILRWLLDLGENMQTPAL